MKEDDILLFYHDDYQKMTQTPGHPESPDRVKTILRTIDERKIPVQIVTPSRIDPELLGRIHDEHHIRRVKDFGIGYMDPDTYHHGHTFDMTLRAAGGVVEAMERSFIEKRAVFTIPRPPGHHAGPDYNMGFCYFNNAALAAKLAIERFDDVDRVAIVDIDAHHGNGTNDIFIEDDKVLYISTHQWGIFPGTGYHNEVGIGKGEGLTMNLPMMGGTGDPTFIESMRALIKPAIEQFFPDMIIVSLGGDSHFMDPLTSLTLSTPGYLELTDALKHAAERCCQGRIIYELEGGYHPQALADVFVGTMQQHLEEPGTIDSRYNETKEKDPDMNRIQQFMDVQSSYWKI